VIAFGEPHNRGFDEREDGKRAAKLVFLDRSGDAYGLNVTLIDDKVVAWQMPAERVLTPEAQQRHLQAMEQRLTERIAEVERKAAQQHAETVKLFNDVMARQDEMIAQLTKPPTPVVTPSGGPPPRPQPSSSPPPKLSGSKTLTINGKVYTDRADGELGRPCGIDNNTCTSPQYACSLMTSKSGVCVPR
jgi:hypothetical protein